MLAIFPDFWHPVPHVSSFLVLSVGNFDRFLTPSPSLNCRRHLWTAPNRISNFFLTTSSNLSNFTLHPYLYFLRNLTSSKIPHYYYLKLVNMCLIKKISFKLHKRRKSGWFVEMSQQISHSNLTTEKSGLKNFTLK